MLIVVTNLDLGILGHVFLDMSLFLVIGYSIYMSALEVVITQWAKAKSSPEICINAGGL